MDYIIKFQALSALCTSETYRDVLQMATTDDPGLREQILEVIPRIIKILHRYLVTKQLQHYEGFLESLESAVKVERVRIKQLE